MGWSRHAIIVGAVLFGLCATGLAQAEVTLASPFGDHMVLQREYPAPVWGQAAPGEKVEVTVAGQKAEGVADKQGQWKVTLPARPAGGPYTLTVAGQNQIEIKDVLIGEVWLASGQSNMQFALSRANDASGEVAEADHRTIHFFQVSQVMATEPQTTCEGAWTMCSPETAGSFSAVAYFFARDLQKRLGVPIGILQAAWSGSPIQPFLDQATLAADPAYGPLLAHLDRARKDPRLLEAEEWPTVPSSVYNTLINPLAPYGMRGVIWYQGEGNVGEAEEYRRMFPALIRGWRRVWGQGDFPFLFVQLANYGRPSPPEGPGDSERAELREAQMVALALPNTGMAVAIDIGAGRDAHPKNKQDVGRRLALVAGHVVYGWKEEYSGPVFRELQIKGDTARVRFTHADGLTAKGGEAKGFALAGADRKYYWATAKIEGDTVVLSSPEVPHPVAASYAWGDDPPCSLYNGAGLPAIPFRTVTGTE